MIKLVGLASIVCLALFGMQNGGIQENYDELWGQVIQYEVDQRPQSALKVVERIYDKATRENNNLHLTKAIIYKAKFILQSKERGFEEITQLFAEEIPKSPSPTKEILLSAEAKIYQQYRDQNLYKIQQRKRIDGFDEIDPMNKYIETD